MNVTLSALISGQPLDHFTRMTGQACNGPRIMGLTGDRELKRLIKLAGPGELLCGSNNPGALNYIAGYSANCRRNCGVCTVTHGNGNRYGVTRTFVEACILLAPSEITLPLFLSVSLTDQEKR